MIYILFVLGLIFLLKGADLLVDGSVNIANRFHVKKFVIGITVITIGTTTPELLVNLNAVLSGVNDIAIGNILGSNITNILLILGIAAVITPVSVKDRIIFKEIPFCFVACALLFILVNDKWFGAEQTQILSFGDGLILMILAIVFLYYTISVAPKEHYNKILNTTEFSIFKSITMVVFGAICLFFGGNFIVHSGMIIATNFGISQALIGLSAISIGTSLPELATAIVGSLKKEEGIVIGNLIGSTITNIFWVLGLSSLVANIEFNKILNFDLLINLFAIALVFVIILFIGKKKLIQRWQGVSLIVFYLLYLSYIFIRG